MFEYIVRVVNLANEEVRIIDGVKEVIDNGECCKLYNGNELIDTFDLKTNVIGVYALKRLIGGL